MATYSTDLQVVNLCDTDTDWAELSGHSSGGAPSDDAENYIHNSVSVSQPTGQASGTNAGMQYTIGSNLGSGWTSGHVFMSWQYYAAPTNLNPWGSAGMALGIGSSAGNMNFWRTRGDDFGGSPYVCWQNVAVDPELTADSTDGSPVADNYSVFGSLPNVRAKITKGNPHAVDVIRYGRGEIKAIGTGANFSGMASANDAATARWGLFQFDAGSYLWKGLMSLGDASNSVTFSDSNKTIRVADTPRVAAGFNKLEIRNTGSSVTLTAITFQGVATSITGSDPVSPGDIEVVDNSTVDFDSCIFADLGTIVFNDGTNPNDIIASKFVRDGIITQNGSTFTGNTYTSCSPLTVDDLDLITKCVFESAGTGHAVNLGTYAADDTIAWDNTDTGYGATDTTNATITVNVPSGITLTINVSDTATTPTYNNTAGTPGTVSIIAGQKTFSFALNPSITGYEWRIYDVNATGSLTGAVELDGEETASADNQSYAYSYVADDAIAVQIIDDNYVESVTYYTFGNSDQDVTITLKPEENV